MASIGDAAGVDPGRCRRVGHTATSESVDVVADASSPSRAGRDRGAPERPGRPTIRCAARWPADRASPAGATSLLGGCSLTATTCSARPSVHEAPLFRGTPAARGRASGAAGGTRGIPRSRYTPTPMRMVHVRLTASGFAAAHVVRVRAVSGFARRGRTMGRCASARSEPGGARSDGRRRFRAEARRWCGLGRRGHAGRRERAMACVGDPRACERLCFT